MAEYQLYDQQNYSVLIDPQSKEAQGYQSLDIAKQIAQEHNALIIRESIPPKIKENIEQHLGKIEYSDERINSNGHYAIVKDKVHGTYSALKIEKGQEGYEIQVKSGFPDQKQAYTFIEKQQSMEKKLQQLSQELSR